MVPKVSIYVENGVFGGANLDFDKGLIYDFMWKRMWNRDTDSNLKNGGILWNIMARN
jgi:hypothetical protein